MEAQHQYKYILKVAEELLFNACPSELIQKYKKLKEISLSKIDKNDNGAYSSSQSQSPLTNAAFSQDTKGLSALLENSFESTGKFIDIIKQLTLPQSSQISPFSSRVFELTENLKEQITNLQSYQMQNSKQQLINNSQNKMNIKFVSQYERLGQNMLQCLWDMNSFIQQKQQQSSNKDQDTSNNEIEQQLMGVIEERENELHEQQVQLRMIRSEYDELTYQLEGKNTKIEELQNLLDELSIKQQHQSTASSDSVKNSNYMNHQIKELQDKIESLQQEVLEANQSIKEYRRLEMQQKSMQENCDSKINSSRVVSELQHFVRTFQEEFEDYTIKYSEAFNEFERKSSQSILADSRLKLLLFIAYLFNKFEGDNSWLVERLQDVTQQNSLLKYQNFNSMSSQNNENSNTRRSTEQQQQQQQENEQIMKEQLKSISQQIQKFEQSTSKLQINEGCGNSRINSSTADLY